MLSDLNAIDISSEYDSPIHPIVVEEEIMSILIGPLSIPKWKRQAHRPSPTLPQKRQTLMSARMKGEGIA